MALKGPIRPHVKKQIKTPRFKTLFFHRKTDFPQGLMVLGVEKKTFMKAFKAALLCQLARYHGASLKASHGPVENHSCSVNVPHRLLSMAGMGWQCRRQTGSTLRPL